MADLAILTPSRGRPDQFAQLVNAVSATTQEPVCVWLGLDDDDPTADAYLAALERVAVKSVDGAHEMWTPMQGAAARLAAARPLQRQLVEVAHQAPVAVHVVRGPRRSLSAWTNHLAEAAVAVDTGDQAVRFLASLGDDHRPRTHGWDRLLAYLVEQCPGGVGFAYGNDLLQGENLPTAWVTSVATVEALGWMMLPDCAHLYVDRAVLEVGRAAGCLRYWHSVTVEHLHPAAGKGHWDDSYQVSNSQASYDADGAAFERWKATGGLDAAAARLREAAGRKAGAR